MDDRLIAAIELAFSYSLEMVAWSAGLIVFSAGFLSEKVKVSQAQKWMLRGSLLLYSLSVIFGVVCLSALIGRLGDPITEEAVTLRDAIPYWVQFLAGAQFLSFLVATLVALGIALARTAPIVSRQR